MDIFSNVTIIFPTLNSAGYIREHLDHFAPVLGHFGQIVAVDGYSEDGTFEVLRDRLGGFGAELWQRPRGLYASWNDAIGRATCPYVYMSTVADLPDLDELEAFFEAAISSGVDLAVSPPLVHDGDGESERHETWPIHNIIRDFSIDQPRVLGGDVLRQLNAYSLVQNGLCSLSGSFASNLAKSEMLKANPFPTHCKGAGDTLWMARVSGEIRMMIYPRPVAQFLRHEKSYSRLEIEESAALVRELFAHLPVDEEMVAHCLEREAIGSYLREQKERMGLFRYLIPEVHRARKAKRSIREAKKERTRAMQQALKALIFEGEAT